MNNNMFKLDCERFHTIGKIIQNSLLYFIFLFVLTSILEDILPKKDVKKEKYSILFEIIIQFLFLLIGIFYIHKMINIIPYIGHSNYEVDDISIIYIEILIIVMVVLMTQPNFIAKINFLLGYTEEDKQINIKQEVKYEKEINNKQENCNKETMINKKELSYSTDISHLPY